MSNFYDDQVRCPKCGISPIAALDSTDGTHIYTYRCPRCEFSSRDYDAFEKMDPTATMRIKDGEE